MWKLAEKKINFHLALFSVVGPVMENSPPNVIDDRDNPPNKYPINLLTNIAMVERGAG